jgi:outer membrane usher protein
VARLPHALGALSAALLCVAAYGQVPAPAGPQVPSVPTQGRPIALEAIVHGVKAGTWVFIERGRELYAPREAIEEWRLRLADDVPSITFRGQEYRALSSIPGFRSRIDSSTQSVELLFSPEAFTVMRLTKELGKLPPPSPVQPTVFLNYDASVNVARPRDSKASKAIGALTELGLSTQLGVFTQSSVASRYVGPREPDEPRRRPWLRLETTFTHDFPETNRTLRIGDTVTRSLMWGRDVYFGGIRYGTNFALYPGFVSQPLPVVQGTSSAPSTVELYVNDVLRQVSQVPTGPFVIDNFPMLSSTGEARMVVRDLLGRETVLVQNFFTSSQLLAPGLTDFSVEAGRVRRGLGVESNDYGPGFTAGTWRHGFSDRLTLEGRGEASKRLGVLGGSVLAVAPWQILTKLAVVGSTHDVLGSGGLWLTGVEYSTQRSWTSVEVSGASRGYRDVAIEEGRTRPRRQTAGNWTYSHEQFGNFGMGFARIERYDSRDVTTYSANYSVRVGKRSTLSLVSSHAKGAGSSVSLSLIIPFDSSTTVNTTYASHDGESDYYASAIKNPGLGSDYGWRVLAGSWKGLKRAEGGVYYEGSHGAVSGDASFSDQIRAARLNATGSLIYAENDLFAGRRFLESFAIVEVPGQADIGVGLGSNVLARTNAAGIAIVPQLTPYVRNSIRLDPKELPISAEIDSIEMDIVPSWRSAVKVVFPVRGGRGALLRLVLDDGQPAPAGATVTVAGDKEIFYVARRGEAFVTGLKDTDRVILTWKEKQCEIAIELPATKPDEITRVGPLSCRGVPR